MSIRAQPVPAAEDRASGGARFDGSWTMSHALDSAGADTGDSGDQYLEFIPSSSGNRKRWTLSFWIKRNAYHSSDSILSAANLSDSDWRSNIYFDASGNLWFDNLTDGVYEGRRATGTREFYDTHAWTNYVCVYDTPNSTGDDRVRVYVNGVQNTEWGWADSDPTQDVEGTINTASYAHRIGSLFDSGLGGSSTTNCSLCEYYFVDGEALDASSFGYTDPLTNNWRPKKFEWNSSGGSAPFLATLSATPFPYSGVSSGNATNTGSVDAVSAGTNSFNISTAAQFDESAGNGIGNAQGLTITNAVELGDEYTIDYYANQVGTQNDANGTVITIREGSSGTTFLRDYNDSGQRKLNIGSDTFDYGASGSTSDLDWWHIRITNTGCWYNGTLISGQVDSLSGYGDAGDGLTMYIGNYTGMTNSYRHEGLIGPIRIANKNLGAPPSGGLPTTAGSLPVDDLNGTKGGINSYYLPMDGSSPLWIDKSGHANDFKPYQVVATADLSKATGALPILNTVNGGNTATSGVRGQVGVAVSVYNTNYYLDGVETPSLNMYRGQTVTFDLGDTTNGTHPLKFSTTSDGTHGGGSEYTDGVATGAIAAGTAGAATTITFPYDAENTLYYYCGNHSSMGGSVGLSTNIEKADTHASGCVLAIPWVGGEVESQADTYRDYSAQVNAPQATKTVTRAGSPRLENYPHNFYGCSCYFNKSNGTDRFYLADSADWDFGTGDYTAECWVYLKEQTDQYVVAREVSSSWWGINFWSNGGTTNTVRAGYNAKHEVTYQWYNEVWYHVAVSRQSGTSRLFINGYLLDSQSDTDDITAATTLEIGHDANSWGLWANLYLSDLRIYKGVAKYTKDFIPASARPAIRADSPSASAYGGKLAVSPYGGCWQSGNKWDYLNVLNHSDFSLSGDFTVEAFCYQPDTTGTVFLVGSQGNSNDADGWSYYVGSSGATCNWYTGGSADVSFDNAYKNRWTHFAITRSGSTIYAFADGRLQGTSTNSNTFTGNIRIGAEYSNTTLYNSSKQAISNFRLTNGTCLYTQDFAPPTKPLEALANTKLLCCKNEWNSCAYEVSPYVISEGGEWVVAGDPTATSTAPGTKSGSVEFDGSGDYMYIENPYWPIRNWWHGNSGFTVEYWIKADAFGEGQNSMTNVFGHGTVTSGTTEYWSFGPIADGTVKFYYWTGSGQIVDTGEVLSTGTWYHLALVYSGGWAGNGGAGSGTGANYGDLKIYIDGVQKIQASSVTAWPQSSASYYIVLGKMANYNEFDGMISNLRISNFARYTSNFTPQSTDLVADEGTMLLACNSSSKADLITSNLPSSTMNPFDSDVRVAQGPPDQYAILNQTWSNSSQTNGNYLNTIRDGGLSAWFNVSAADSKFKSVCSTLGIDSSLGGKWYFEMTGGGGGFCQFGICREDRLWQIGKSGWGISGSGFCPSYQTDGGWQCNVTTTQSNVWDSTESETYGAVFGVGVDMDNGILTGFVNGIKMGIPFNFNGAIDNESFPLWYPMISVGNFSASDLEENEIVYCNFGQTPFRFAPPAGYQPLNASNIGRPETPRPDKNFGIVKYVGDGNSPRTVTGFGFAPDLIWYKETTQQRDHQLYDTVRGVGPGKNLVSNTEYAQASNDDTSYGYTSGFTSDGWTMTNGSAGSGNNDIYTNDSGETYICWAWKAGGSAGTFNKDGVDVGSAAAAGLSGGDITPSACSIGTKEGFSIIQYTGTASGTPSVPHGLTKEPNFIITKDTGAATSWRCFAMEMPNVTTPHPTWKIANLNNDDAFTSASETDPTSSLFYVNGNGNAANAHIAYIWHNVTGVQKFGSYRGNAENYLGPYVYTGFRPAMVMIKRMDSSTSANWHISDKVRSPINYTNKLIFPNLYNAEESHAEYQIDFYSTGFKIKAYGTNTMNRLDADYFFAAWADIPTTNMFGQATTTHFSS